MSQNWIVREPSSVDQYLEKNQDKIAVGDTIEYISNNQQGWMKYKVVEEDGKKILNLIDSYDMLMERVEHGEFYNNGGKKQAKRGKKQAKRGKKQKKTVKNTKKRNNKKRKSVRRK
jgi:hypothetical protein